MTTSNDHGFKVRAASPEDIEETVLQNWQNTWIEAGFSDDQFVEGWKDQIYVFLKAATTAGLKPQVFVAQDKDGKALGSVACQIWSGPIPWVVQPEVFQLGTLWGLGVDGSLVQSAAKANTIRQDLLRVALTHLQGEKCSKVVTLASSPSQREKMIRAGVGFEQANMLTLDLVADQGWKTVPSTHFASNKYTVGPAGPEHDKTVCSHWRLMWQDVGILEEALLVDMEQITECFLKRARESLKYQTFLATCTLTHKVVGSVSCQIWEGPFPKIVSPEAFQMGTIWAVYVDPAYRRQGVATELMKLALQHLKDTGCDSAILIAASEGGQCVYERLGFRANNALVCDLKKPAQSDEVPSEGETAEEKKQDDSPATQRPTMQDLRHALNGVGVAVSDPQANALRTATMQQLLAVYGDHPEGQALIRAVVAVQQKHGTFVDPQDNWFTQHLSKLGRGFDMSVLQADPEALASKFDRLAHRYDHWTVGNRSQVESFIVRCATETSQALPKCGRNSRVLDVACGIGLQGQVLRMCGYQGELVGTDISPGMVQRVVERGCYDFSYVSDANRGLACSRDGVATSPVYDVVICTGAMELLHHKDTLAKFSRLVKPNGEFWVSFQHDRADKPNPTQHQNVRGITRERAVRLLKETGFDCVFVDACPDAFYTPSPAQDGTLLAVPYLFILAKKRPDCAQSLCAVRWS